jgi:hypothetical protein
MSFDNLKILPAGQFLRAKEKPHDFGARLFSTGRGAWGAVRVAEAFHNGSRASVEWLAQRTKDCVSG